jgi:hypothetical protein
MLHKVLFRMLESTMAKKRGSPIGVDPIEKIKAIMNNRHTPVQVQLRAAIALLDHEHGKRAIAGEPGLGADGKHGLTALLLRAQMENERLRPPGGRPPAGDLKSATAAETASKPAAASESEAPPAEAPKEAVIEETKPAAR